MTVKWDEGRRRLPGEEERHGGSCWQTSGGQAPHAREVVARGMEAWGGVAERMRAAAEAVAVAVARAAVAWAPAGPTEMAGVEAVTAEAVTRAAEARGMAADGNGGQGGGGEAS